MIMSWCCGTFVQKVQQVFVVLAGFLACMACSIKILAAKDKLQKWPGIPEFKFIIHQHRSTKSKNGGIEGVCVLAMRTEVLRTWKRPAMMIPVLAIDSRIVQQTGVRTYLMQTHMYSSMYVILCCGCRYCRRAKICVWDTLTSWRISMYFYAFQYVSIQ